MAEILHSNLETDFRQASILAEGFRVSMYHAADIRSIPGAIDNLGSVNGSKSDTHQIRFADLGADPMVVRAETDQVVGTAVTTSTNTPTVAVVRQSLAREISDLAVLTGGAQDLDPMTLLQWLLPAYVLRFQDLIAAAVATFSGGSAGSTGVDLSVSDYFDALFVMMLSDANGPFTAMMHNQQCVDLISSMRGEGGPLQFLADAQRSLALQGQGYQGELLGVQVFRSPRITANATDRLGGMWSAGALGYKTGTIDSRSMIGATGLVLQQGEMTAEIVHVAGGGKTKVFGDVYVGVGVLEQARTCLITSDK